MATVSAQVPWGFEREIFTIKLSRAQPKVNMSQRQGCNVSVVGSRQANVTVNSQDQVTQPAMVTTPIQPRPGHVIITPLANATSMTIPSQVIGRSSSSNQLRQQTTPALRHSLQSLGHAGPSQATESIISKLLLKAVCKSTKHTPKTFTLRDVDIASINSRSQLRKVIKEQLQDDLVKEFDVGYYEGSTVVSIRSPRDLAEVWNNLKAGKKVTLWCDGLKEEECGKNKKRKRVEVTVDSEESDEEEADFQKRSGNKKHKYKLKDKKLEKIVADLKEKHGSTYTALQYRIWAELVDSELANASEPPENSMFSRAGRGSTSSSTQKKSEVAEAISEVAKQLFNPKPQSGQSSIENRSRCYSQLSELNNLKVAGVLTEEEYAAEKCAIMNALKKL